MFCVLVVDNVHDRCVLLALLLLVMALKIMVAKVVMETLLVESVLWSCKIAREEEQVMSNT